MRPIVANVSQMNLESLPDRLRYVFNNRLIIRLPNKQNTCILSCLSTIASTCLCLTGQPPLTLLLYCRYLFTLHLLHLVAVGYKLIDNTECISQYIVQSPTECVTSVSVGITGRYVRYGHKHGICIIIPR